MANSKEQITTGDIEFVRHVLLPWSEVRAIYLEWDNSKKVYPDIWLSYRGRIPMITVTREWARQTMKERHKRLVHEFLHILGMEHDGSIDYNTYPNKDKYSEKMYRRLIR